MVLDPVLAGRIASVRTLETLELTRVSVRDVEAVRAALASASFRVLHVEEGSAHVLNAVRGMYEPVSELRLEGRWLGPDVLSALSRMRHLRIVRLSQTEISNYGLSFLRNLPGLEALHLDEETVNNQSPMYLRGLPLRSLSCRCPGLGDVGARHLRQLNALERLRLEDTALTNEGVTSLGQLSALTDIVLAGADVADVGLRALTVLPGLRRLDLRSASLDDADLRPLAEATSLRALTLRGPGVKDPTLRIIADLERRPPGPSADATLCRKSGGGENLHPHALHVRYLRQQLPGEPLCHHAFAFRTTWMTAKDRCSVEACAAG